MRLEWQGWQRETRRCGASGSVMPRAMRVRRVMGSWSASVAGAPQSAHRGSRRSLSARAVRHAGVWYGAVVRARSRVARSAWVSHLPLRVAWSGQPGVLQGASDLGMVGSHSLMWHVDVARMGPVTRRCVMSRGHFSTCPCSCVVLRW